MVALLPVLVKGIPPPLFDVLRVCFLAQHREWDRNEIHNEIRQMETRTTHISTNTLDL